LSTSRSATAPGHHSDRDGTWCVRDAKIVEFGLENVGGNSRIVSSDDVPQLVLRVRETVAGLRDNRYAGSESGVLDVEYPGRIHVLNHIETARWQYSGCKNVEQVR
jgi:hypothetical protein